MTAASPEPRRHNKQPKKTKPSALAGPAVEMARDEGAQSDVGKTPRKTAPSEAKPPDSESPSSRTLIPGTHVRISDSAPVKAEKEFMRGKVSATLKAPSGQLLRRKLYYQFIRADSPVHLVSIYQFPFSLGGCFVY